MTAAGKTVYLETLGCQMNVLDSELVLGQLSRLGYRPVEDMHAADLVLLNTCSVREHAEAKAYSRLGQLKRPRRPRPGRIVGVIGCLAERDAPGLLERTPHVDLICGPGQLNHIPALIAEIESQRARQPAPRAVALSSERSRRLDPALRSTRPVDSLEALDRSRRPLPGTSVLQSYIRVQRGCDKFCTFCVVPFTRGPERSRSPQALVDEARMLVDRGAREITLLGQTVNSYAHLEGGRRVRFSDLLSRVHDIAGLDRLRFVTSFPGDFGDDILEAMRDLPKVCEYLHLPAQSGSDAVLRRMRRQYTVRGYRELLHRARQIVPGVELASDFIVGFPGESRADFEATLGLVREVGFKNIFCFRYSPRPGTAAVRRLPDDVPAAVKARRNTELLAAQQAVALRRNRRLIGRTLEILVEGPSKAAIRAQGAEPPRSPEVGWRCGDQLVGRTRGDQIVVFAGGPELVGRMVCVRVVAATALTLHAARDQRGGSGRDSAPGIPVLAARKDQAHGDQHNTHASRAPFPGPPLPPLPRAASGR